MSQSFLILTDRFGGDTRNPSDAELDAALKRVFIEDHPQLTDADYAEHGGASLRFGQDDGPMFVLHANRQGQMMLEQWADADFEQELAPPMFLQGVSADEALRLWQMARSLDIDGLREEAWLPV